jgi:multiple antibiotic resistance protein
METLSAAVMLFLIMDPMGNLPVFTSILKHVEKKRRRVILIRELLIALAIMMSFLFMGEQILNFLSLKKEAVSISGAIILFLIGLKMIFPPEGGLSASLGAGDEPLIVPLAIPMIAGPSILATLLLLAHQEPDRMVDWSLALIGAWSVTTVILMFSELFQRIIGEKGLTAIERLMGMLLLMISVQMFLDGITSYFTHI